MKDLDIAQVHKGLVEARENIYGSLDDDDTAASLQGEIQDADEKAALCHRLETEIATFQEALKLVDEAIAEGQETGNYREALSTT